MYSCICSVALFVFLCLSTYCLLFLPSFFFFYARFISRQLPLGNPPLHGSGHYTHPLAFCIEQQH